MTGLPEGANSCTTIELSSNILGTARCGAPLVRCGKTTQIWDAEASDGENGKTIALLRRRQMIRYPQAQAPVA